MRRPRSSLRLLLIGLALVVAACGRDLLSPAASRLATKFANLIGATTCGGRPSFSGFNWIVYANADPNSPDVKGSPTQWSTSNACITADGSLQLTVGRDLKDTYFTGGHIGLRAIGPDGIETEARLSYGSYRYAVGALPSPFDPNAVVGLFSFGGTATEKRDELDVELTRAWGESALGDLKHPKWWLHYTMWPNVAPADGHGLTGLKDTVSLAQLQVPTTHQFVWNTDAVSFSSIVTSNGSYLGSWTTDPTQAGKVPNVPAAVFLELWMAADSANNTDACIHGSSLNPQGNFVGQRKACGPWTVSIAEVHLPVPVDAENPGPQRAAPGHELPDPIQVRVHDAVGNAMPGVTVDFVVAGGGSLDTYTATTDSAGHASARWTLGASGDQAVTASVRNSTLGPVVFTATFSPSIVLSPAALGFDVVAGHSVTPQTVAITNGGGGSLTALAFGAVQYANGAGWLSATLSSTTAPATITVTPNVAGLAPGTYNANIPVSAADASNTPQLVAVTLVVRAPPHLDIVFSSDRATPGIHQIFAMLDDGSSVTRLTTTATLEFNPVWSPDRSKIAFASERSGSRQIWVMNADGSNPVQLTNRPGLNFEPAWSPDGSRIAFESNGDGYNQIYVMNSDGSTLHRLTSSYGDYHPSWSPFGNQIAFTRITSYAVQDIYLMNVDGTGAYALTSNAGINYTPSWSPDGTKIAFTSDRNGGQDVWVMNADGSNQSQLTFAATSYSPTWMPGSDALVFASNRSGVYQLYRVGLSGTGLTQLSSPPTGESYGPNRLTPTPLSPPQPALLYADDFSNGLGNWLSVGGGSWSTPNNELIGDYNIGCGSITCSQADLLLIDPLQPGNRNWRMEVKSNRVEAYCCYNGGAQANFAKFSVFVSANEKDDFEVGNSWVPESVTPATTDSLWFGLQAYYPWHWIGNGYLVVPTWQTDQWQTAALEKRGNQLTLYWNGIQVYTVTRSYSSAPKVGLHTYGKVRMDDFKLYALP